MQAVGGPIARAAIPVMQDLTAAFTGMGNFANAHPEAIKMAAEAAAILAGALVALGTGAVLGASLVIVRPVASAARALANVMQAVASIGSVLIWRLYMRDSLRSEIDSSTAEEHGFGHALRRPILRALGPEKVKISRG